MNKQVLVKFAAIIPTIIAGFLFKETVPLDGNGTPPFWLHASQRYEYSSQILHVLILIYLLILGSVALALWLILRKPLATVIIAIFITMFMVAATFLIGLQYINFI